MRNCNSITHEKKAFNEINLNKIVKDGAGRKAIATFKRKPYETVLDCTERLKIGGKNENRN